MAKNTMNSFLLFATILSSLLLIAEGQIVSSSAVQMCQAEDNLPCTFGRKVVINYLVTPNLDNSQKIAVSSAPIRDGDDAYLVPGELTFSAPYPASIFHMAHVPDVDFTFRRTVEVDHQNFACNCGQSDYTCCVSSTTSSKNFRRFCGIRDLDGCQTVSQLCTSYAMGEVGPRIQIFRQNLETRTASVNVIYINQRNDSNGTDASVATSFTVGLTGSSSAPMEGFDGLMKVEIISILDTGVTFPVLSAGALVRPADEDMFVSPYMDGWDRRFLFTPESELLDTCGSLAMSKGTYCNELSCDQTCINCIPNDFNDRLEQTNNCQTSAFLLPLELYNCSFQTSSPLGWQIDEKDVTKMYDLQFTFNGKINILITLPINDTDQLGLITRFSNVVGSFGTPAFLQGTETQADGRIVVILDNRGSWDTVVCLNITCEGYAVSYGEPCTVAKPGQNTFLVTYISNKPEGGQCCLGLSRDVDSATVFNGCLNVTAKSDKLPGDSSAEVNSSDCKLGICNGGHSKCGITDLAKCFDFANGIFAPIITILILFVICVAVFIGVTFALRFVKSRRNVNV